MKNQLELRHAVRIKLERQKLYTKTTLHESCNVDDYGYIQEVLCILNDSG